MTDKFKHLIAGMLVALVFRPWLGLGAGVLAAAVAGGLKEAYDAAFDGDVSAADFMATVAGGVLVEMGFSLADA